MGRATRCWMAQGGERCACCRGIGLTERSKGITIKGDHGLISEHTQAPPVTSRNAGEVLEAGHCQQAENRDDNVGSK